MVNSLTYLGDTRELETFDWLRTFVFDYNFVVFSMYLVYSTSEVVYLYLRLLAFCFLSVFVSVFGSFAPESKKLKVYSVIVINITTTIFRSITCNLRIKFGAWIGVWVYCYFFFVSYKRIDLAWFDNGRDQTRERKRTVQVFCIEM